MEHLEVRQADHEAEEECLFFVALSRARDVLSITSAKRYTAKQTCNPSKYLKSVGPRLPKARLAPLVPATTSAKEIVPVVPRDTHDARELLIWTKCPARYRYEVVDGLGDRSAGGAYLAFHRCVRATVDWISTQRAEGHAVDPAAARQRLAEVWAERGPLTHGFEPVYRAAAETMVENAVALLDDGGRALDRRWGVAASGRHIRVRADRVIERPDGTVVAQIYKTGRKSKSESEKAIWELMEEALRQAHPGRDVVLQAVYPGTSEVADIAADQAGAGIGEYLAAIAGIEAGSFQPKPSSDCPTCRFYFVCTSEDSF